MYTIEEIIARIQRDKEHLGITLFEPASEADISSFEHKMQIKLPDDLKTFYRFCNGFESHEDMFRIIPLDEIWDNRLTGRDVSNEDGNRFDFAEYMIYGDVWLINIDQQDCNNYSIHNFNSHFITLSNSFTEFLDVFFIGGLFEGLYEWTKAIEKSEREAGRIQ